MGKGECIMPIQMPKFRRCCIRVLCDISQYDKQWKHHLAKMRVAMSRLVGADRSDKVARVYPCH